MCPFPAMVRTRRQFLSSSAALASIALLPVKPAAQSTGAHASRLDDRPLETIPNDTLLKFRPDGTPRPFAGNTVICHLPQQTRFRDAVVDLGEALRTSSFARKLAILPSDSYHVTIFGGPNDQDRARYGWPSDIPRDVSMRDCNLIIGGRVARFGMPCDLPLRFHVDQRATLAPQLASGLQLVAADPNEKQKLHTLRAQLAAKVFRYHPDDLETFGFHISLAYQIRGFTPEENRDYQDLLERHVSRILDAAPVVELGEPEFCTFEDMRRFEIKTLLST